MPSAIVRLAFCIVFIINCNVGAFSQEDSDQEKKRVIETLKFFTSDPLIIPEFKPIEDDFTEYVISRSYLKESHNIIPLREHDLMFSKGNQGLLLMISPTCKYCLQTIEELVNREYLKGNFVIIRWTPDFSWFGLSAAMYNACKLSKLSDLYQRLNTSVWLTEDDKKDWDHDKKMANLQRRSNLTLADLKECRTMAEARKFVDNIKILMSHCRSLSCDKELGGYIQTRIRGEVHLGRSPGVPAWFYGKYSADDKTFTFDVAETGLTKLIEFLDRNKKVSP